MARAFCHIPEGESEAISARIGTLVETHSVSETLATSELNAKRSKIDEKLNIKRILVDEENDLSPLQRADFDAVISNLNIHWINDLEGVLSRICSLLVPDGLFLATAFGEDTLQELRVSLQLAELERTGGLSPRISPMIGK